ncbi:MAG TPA: N-acetylmuramoyl-L-alanine amidase [Actinomycetota bacterium]|nr:N-acetylmuramoyl-L-alanine amidase [Actinomycetota bacterium]
MGLQARFRETTPTVTRRHFMQMAILATSSVALPLPRLWAAQPREPGAAGGGEEVRPPRYCTPGATGLDPGAEAGPVRLRRIDAPRNGDWSGVAWPFGGGRGLPGHYQGAPRADWIMVHHTGAPNAHLETDACADCYYYDFCIDRSGDICVNGRWDDSTGAHARGCNCRAVGIMLYGCFGGCNGGNVSAPSNAQLCSLAWLSLHLGTTADVNHHKPHARCASWNPCDDPNPTITVCCGDYLTEPHYSGDANKWSTTGESLMRDMLTYRSRLARGCSCFSGQACD